MIKLYRNLNKGTWSIKHGDRPVTHSDSLTALNVTFKVSEKRRQAVLAKGHREVHAWAVATSISKDTLDASGLIEVTYNPYRCGEFTTRDGKAVTSCAALTFLNNGKCYASGVRYA